MAQFRPMLAAPVGKLQLKFPLLASPKLDGIRALVSSDHRVMSRSLKLIPNKHVQSMFAAASGLSGLDGELIVGDPTQHDVYLKSVSALMTHTGTPEFTFWVFDDFTTAENPFYRRMSLAKERVEAFRGNIDVRYLEQVRVDGKKELMELEDEYLSKGYEGVVLRSSTGLYKYGRSTERQGWLLKLKRFEDSEAEIIGFVEKMTNGNEATINELGYKERSSHKDNKIAAGMLGALSVRDIKTGVEFEIGTGFTDEQRKEFWSSKDTYMGQIVKYRHFPTGVKDKPRIPSYKGLRSPIDM